MSHGTAMIGWGAIGGSIKCPGLAFRRAREVGQMANTNARTRPVGELLPGGLRPIGASHLPSGSPGARPGDRCVNRGRQASAFAPDLW
jgi:hypothetical protein